MYYSAAGILAIIVLLIVNHDLFLNRSGDFRKPAWKVYRRFLFAVLIYYVTDVLWGALESRKLSALLFADTTVYFAAMSISLCRFSFRWTARAYTAPFLSATSCCAARSCSSS